MFIEDKGLYQWHHTHYQSGGLLSMLSSERASQLSAEQVGTFAQTDPKHGLSTDEALRRAKLYGDNEFDVEEDEPLIFKYLEQVWVLIHRDIV